MTRTPLFSSLAVALLATTALPATAQSFVYVGEFGGALHRFNLDGTPNPPGDFINGATVTQVEGIESVDDRLVFAAVVNGQRGVHYFSKATGAYLSTPVIVDAIDASNVILDMKIAPNGNSVYVAQYNRGIRQFDLNTGASLSNVSTQAQPWGVAVHPITGEIYHTAGWDVNSAANRGVYRTGADLSGLNGVVTSGLGNLNGLTAPSGLTFLPDGTLFVVNGANGDPNNTFVNRYAYDPNTNTYSFVETLDTTDPNNPDFRNGFDIEVGPDGNIYVTNEEGACVVKFDLANGNAFSAYIPPAAGGLPSAKTIHFDVNAVITVPEPGTYALLGGMVALGGLVVRRRRK